MTPAPRLSRDTSTLVVIDIQEKLLPAIFEKDRVVTASARLARGAGILNLPVIATEQYRKGLGPTDPEIASAISGFAPIEKMAFSACGAPAFLAALQSLNRPNIILCGIEAHVCVLQTCLDLLEHGVNVFVAADAVSSRTPDNAQLGLARMRDAGAVIVSSEMVLFELLKEAGTPQFKQILPLVK